MSNPTLGDALHRAAADVGELGDIDRALHDVRTRRIRITVGTVAATCLAILLVVVAIPTPASVEPAGPKPAPSPAVEVLQAVPDTVPSIAEAPLLEGADMASVVGDQAVVWAKGMPRRVANTFHTYWTSLSPDGRYHARSEGFGKRGGDVLVVTDLTTGRELLREEMFVDGKGAQAPRFVWSGDSQRLFLVMIQTERQVPPGILHVWQRAGDTFQQVGKRIPLPGPLIGANEDGSVALVEDSGRLAKLAVDGGAWQRTSVAYPSMDFDPGSVNGWQLGQGCWSEVLHRACWVRLGGIPLSTTGVGWVDTTTGRSMTSSTTPPGESTFAGWRDGDPVLLNSPNAEHAQLVVLQAAGQATLREFANPSRPSDAIRWGVSVPDPGTWGAP